MLHTYLEVPIDDVAYATLAAILIAVDGEKYWIPRSQIRDQITWATLSIWVAEWFLRKKNLLHLAKTNRDADSEQEPDAEQNAYSQGCQDGYDPGYRDGRRAGYQNGYEQAMGQRNSSHNVDSTHRIYRKLASKYHPDRSPASAEFMKDLNELYQSVTR